jgi:hypothetical protein
VLLAERYDTSCYATLAGILVVPWPSPKPPALRGGRPAGHHRQLHPGPGCHRDRLHPRGRRHRRSHPPPGGCQPRHRTVMTRPPEGCGNARVTSRHPSVSAHDPIDPAGKLLFTALAMVADTRHPRRQPSPPGPVGFRQRTWSSGHVGTGPLLRWWDSVGCSPGRGCILYPGTGLPSWHEHQ